MGTMSEDARARMVDAGPGLPLDTAEIPFRFSSAPRPRG